MRILKQPLMNFASLIFCLQFFGFSAEATETAYARNCRLEGGIAWTVNFSSTEDLMLCRFGRSAIGAAEFAELKWNQQTAASISSFLGSAPSAGGVTTCRQYSARYAEAMDSEQVLWGLCIFNDGSAIEADTLARGEADHHNAQLVQALR